jgi:predicted ArsR family transcriptional regulator
MSDFARTHAHRDDPDTSHIAAERAVPLAERHRQMVLDCLEDQGQLSSEQIASLLGLSSLQVMKRISDLRNEGVVIDSGERKPTMSGRPAAIWKLKEEQLDMFGAAP